MSLGSKTLNLNITINKMIAWIGGLWMFTSLVLSLTQAVNLSELSFFVPSGTHGESIPLTGADNGAIIIIVTWIFCIFPTFVNGKLTKAIGGLLFLLISIIVIISSLVTSINLDKNWPNKISFKHEFTIGAVLGWIVPCILEFVAGIMWIFSSFKKK